MNLIHRINVVFPENVTQEEGAALVEKLSQEAVERGFKIEPAINRFDQIRDWARERGIYEKGDPKTQFVKLAEEQGELAKAILKNDKPATIDAIGDCVVVLTNLSELCGLKIEDCITSAYDVILKRKGKMENGTFVKES